MHRRRQQKATAKVAQPLEYKRKPCNLRQLKSAVKCASPTSAAEFASPPSLNCKAAGDSLSKSPFTPPRAIPQARAEIRQSGLAVGFTDSCATAAGFPASSTALNSSGVYRVAFRT